MAGTWQALANQPTFNTSTMILLTDGRIMVQEEATPHWHDLTPDRYGNYANGTWSTLADMSFWRRYYASGVLKDGRVIVIGGEQSGDVGDTNKGEIYDPVTDKWTHIPSPPGWANVGDATCCVLPDGRFMLGNINFPACMIYDPVTNSWAPAASKAVRSNEETWILLPDNTILTVQCFAPFHGEKYLIGTDAWKPEGIPPVTLVDPVMHEIGPAMLMYNRQVVYFGAANSGGHGKTAIYALPPTPNGTGGWMPGPDIPKVGGKTIVCNDCPASLLPNGKVLFTGADFQNNNWGSPVLFFEFDPGFNTIAQVATPPNNGAQLYWSRLMLLPSGQVLFSPSSKNVQCYNPGGGPQDGWRPRITEIIPHHHSAPHHYLLKGVQLSGLSQANTYGDDCNPATNYPLVRLRNILTNEVYYCRTFDFSSRGVTGGLAESARFVTPHLPFGNYELCVVANGISSHCVPFCHASPKRVFRCAPQVRQPVATCAESRCEEPARCHTEHRHECGCEATAHRAEEGCCEVHCHSAKPPECEVWECELDSAASGTEVTHSEVDELRSQVRRLENSLHRLSSFVKADEHEREREEKHRRKDDDDTERREEHEEHEEKKRKK